MTIKKWTKDQKEKLFPYESFPIRFVYPCNDKEQVVAHFVCQDHVDKYIARHNIKKSEYNIWYRDESLKPQTTPAKKKTTTAKKRPKPTATQASHADTPKTRRTKASTKSTSTRSRKKT